MKAKRLIALLLCAMMLVSLLPAAVFAEEAEDEEIVELSFDAEEAEEVLPEETADEETAEEPAEEDEIFEDEVISEEDEAVEDEELPTEEILPEEPETEAAENEFEAAAGTCGDDATWSLTNSGVLTIRGTGNMDDYSVSNPGWLDSSIIVRTIKVEEGITSIGSYAFYSLRDAITEVSLPDSLLYINKCAFMDCGITEIEIPASVKSIGERAFAKNPGLTVIRFDGNAPDIASDAFTDVSATVYYSESTGTWTDSHKLNYGGELNWVSDAAIYGVCGEKVTWKLDDGVLTISGTGEMTNYDTMPWKNYSNYGKDIIKLVVTEGVTSISDYICSGCENLSAVSLPNTLKVIGKGAFGECKKLENIVIPNSVTTIKDNAFWVCGLKSITIPASVTELGSELFLDCPQLSAINIVGTASGFKSVNGIVFSADGKTIVIYPGGKQDKSYTIPTGVTKIEEYAFEVNKFLESVVIPDAVTSIGRRAFFSDANLKSIVLPDNITELSEELFACCESLVNITLPKGLKTLGNYVFYDCGSLGNISLPDSLLSIGDYAFSKCEKFTNVTVPASVTNIGEVAFGWCDTPKTLKFLGDAPNINSRAFEYGEITAYYPAGNATWTSDVMQQYGGTVKWIPYGGHPTPVLQTPANHENFMIIQWSKCEGATGYRLQYREGTGAWTEVKVALTQVNSKGEPRWDYKNAKDGATYTFRVFADFADGTYTESNRMGQMRLRTPKITVKHFGGSDTTGGFRIDWQATTGGSQYKIYYREKGGSWALYTMMPKSANTTFLNIKASITNANPAMPNLVAGHTYEFMVLTCTTVASVTSGYPTPFVSMKF